jgi:hypothetical protein
LPDLSPFWAELIPFLPQLSQSAPGPENFCLFFFSRQAFFVEKPGPNVEKTQKKRPFL